MTDNWTFADDNAAVSHQYMSGLSRTSVVLPWETPLMKQIFGDDGPSLSLSMPLNWGSIPQPFASQSPEIDVPEIPSASRWTCAKYVKHVSDETYMQQRDRTMKGALKSISLEVGLFHWIWAAVFLQSDIATSLGKAAQSDIKSTDPSLCFYWAYMFHLYVYFIHCIDFCNFNFHVFDIFPERTPLTIHICI